MSQNDIARDMTQGPVLRQLAIFAIPVALANALQAIYSMVDMVVVGQVLVLRDFPPLALAVSY
mgnify:CR=1 FL=1